MSSHTTTLPKCFCGRTYPSPIDLEEHRRARGHFPSHVCRSLCKHPPVPTAETKPQHCGCCGKLCERQDILEDHRIATGHCFCPDCNLAFKSQNALETHRRTEMHASEFICCDCDISFRDIHALNAHMASRAHRKPLPQKLPVNAEKSTAVTIGERTCKKCERTFSSPQALQQHSQSVKHKPLSALKCPVGTNCRGNFTSPSALLHHLESGSCQSGMNRDEIYRMVQLSDQDHTIHSPIVPGSLISPERPARRPSLSSEISVDFSDNDSEWSLLTPSLSQGSVGESWVQLSLLEGSQISAEDSLSIMSMDGFQHRCPLCPDKSKSFATIQGLQQHMDSPVHSAKVFHCPNIVLRNPLSMVKKGEVNDKHFSTLSGLAQHLESGACRGGKETFLYCINIIQRHLEQVGYGGTRLLLSDSSVA